jgi:hypothetical protein
MAIMGIGELGRPDLTFKRKFRWTFAVINIAGHEGDAAWSIPSGFLKTAARPNLDIEETEINYMNAKMWIPGKAAWQTTEVVYLDVANAQLEALWRWICQVYNIYDGIQGAAIQNANRTMGGRVSDYTGTGVLTLYDGCGSEIEVWRLASAWPKSIDFGELDYSSSDVCEVKMTLRYADVSYKSICPTMSLYPSCTDCMGNQVNPNQNTG